MKKQKGQDIIEYALMLAVVVGIGFGIYSYGGQGIVNSISNVFDGSGKELYNTANNTANTGRQHDYDDGHVERDSKGRFVSIYPGRH